MRRLARWFVRILVLLVVLAGLGFGVYRWLVPPAAAGALREETFQAEVQPMEDLLLVVGPGQARRHDRPCAPRRPASSSSSRSRKGIG